MSGAETRTAAELLRKLRRERGEVAASPNDGVTASELYASMRDCCAPGIIGAQLHGIAVVDQGARVRELEQRVDAEKRARQAAENEVSRLRVLLKRADQLLDGLRLTGDPVIAGRPACANSECAAVRTEAAALREERNDLRRELAQARLKHR